MQHIALERRCFVLSACQYLIRDDCADDYNVIQGDDPNAVLMRGGSCIVSPFVNCWLTQIIMLWTILTTDLEYSDITRGKFDFDVTGHYARPDAFRLCVSERKMMPISDSVDALADPFAE